LVEAAPPPVARKCPGCCAHSDIPLRQRTSRSAHRPRVTKSLDTALRAPSAGRCGSSFLWRQDVIRSSRKEVATKPPNAKGNGMSRSIGPRCHLSSGADGDAIDDRDMPTSSRGTGRHQRWGGEGRRSHRESLQCIGRLFTSQDEINVAVASRGLPELPSRGSKRPAAIAAVENGRIASGDIPEAYVGVSHESLRPVVGY
jgi:hypothetical protein